MGEDHLTALQIAHLQNIIDKGEQMVCGGAHFAAVGAYQRRIVRMGGVNFQKTDDAVERGADVVAHAGEEAGFGGVGPVSLLHGGAKLAVFLLKLPGVLLLGGQLLFPVALDGPQAETVDGADSNEVKHQSKIMARGI